LKSTASLGLPTYLQHSLTVYARTYFRPLPHVGPLPLFYLNETSPPRKKVDVTLLQIFDAIRKHATKNKHKDSDFQEYLRENVQAVSCQYGCPQSIKVCFLLVVSEPNALVMVVIGMMDWY
jgi:hypothetical protein